MHLRSLRVLLLATLALAPAATAIVLPPEGQRLNHIHVQFEWPAAAGALYYGFELVVDDRSADPFAAGTPVLELLSARTRTLVASGLEFGKRYAWRVRGFDGEPMAWGATHRFQVARLPRELPGITTTLLDAGGMQPGLTLFNIFSTASDASRGGLAVAVDETGTPVWFLRHAAPIIDVRLLGNGRVLFCERQGRGIETTLGGQVTWASPDDASLQVHHEIFPMPGGNLLTLVYEVREVERDGQIQPWAASRIVEFDRTSNAVVWDWSPFDHFSPLDFDVATMETPSVGGAHLPGAYDWTHQNAVVYDAATNSVYTSSRQLSRITRIDYASGEVVYNMGFDMPSGDTLFGDDLFSFQHSPELLPNGNMLLYDNGNRRGRLDAPPVPTTRAVELALSGAPPSQASIVWEWTQPTYAPIVGDADRLPNGNTLVVAGPAGTIHEVDPAGNEVWRLELASGAPDHLIYRAQRLSTLVVDRPGDTDGDGLADEVDNCPDHVNAEQRDCDQDGIGDVCATALGIDACPCDTALGDCPCYDLLDNDGDGLVDFPQDPQCRAPQDPSEEPDCDDGLDNDGDGTADWNGLDLDGDGDTTSPGDLPADADCGGNALRQRESGGCGLGFELALLLTLAGALHTLPRP